MNESSNAAAGAASTAAMPGRKVTVKAAAEPVVGAAGAGAGAGTAVEPVAGAEFESVIGPSITINGDLSGDEDLTIHGQVEGGINFREHTVCVGPQGRVVADVIAKNIIVEGKLKGDLRGSEQVTVASSGQVNGDIHSPRVVLNDGCQFKGNIDMESKAPDAAPHIRAQLSHTRRFPERLAERLVPPQPGELKV